VIGPGSATLARQANWLYLKPMVRPYSPPQQVSAAIPPRRVAQVIVTGGASIGAIALVGALALWFHYGTTVFFETIAAGISACF